MHEAAFGAGDVRGIIKRAIRGRHAVDRVDILDPDRHAHQRAEIGAGGEKLVDGGGGGHRLVRRDMLIGVKLGVERLDTVEIGPRRRGGGGPALAQILGVSGDTAILHGVGGIIGHGILGWLAVGIVQRLSRASHG